MKALKGFAKGFAWIVIVIAIAVLIQQLGTKGHPIAALAVYWAIPVILTVWGAFDFRSEWRQSRERYGRSAGLYRKTIAGFYAVILIGVWAAHIIQVPSFPR